VCKHLFSHIYNFIFEVYKESTKKGFLMTNDMTVLSLEAIKEGLQGERLLLVADATGISYPTINKLYKGDVENYSYKTVKAVSDYLIKK
tara:strand:- start:4008 stop:4274 length:267 start_codon:yes stop_codon:yes gene_type:complete